MKEFALKHPWMTFFLVDAAITGVVKLVYALTGYHDHEHTETGYHEHAEEPEEDDKCEEVSE